MVNVMCIMEKEGKKCKKCMKDKHRYYWNGMPLTNKGKMPQKAPVPKQLVPVVEIKMTCPQKATEKAGKLHIIAFLLLTDLHPPLEAFQLSQASSSHWVCSPSPNNVEE